VQRRETVGQAPQLHVALVWGAQWLPEPFWVLPPESQAAAAVVAAGLSRQLRFVPDRAGADVVVQPGVPADHSACHLPAADVIGGGCHVTGGLRQPDRVRTTATATAPSISTIRHGTTITAKPADVEDAGAPGTRDIVYGASFIP